MAEKTLAPTRKVWAGGVASGVAFLLVSIANRRGWAITAEEAVAFNGLFTSLISYLVPNKTVTQKGEEPAGE